MALLEVCQLQLNREAMKNFLEEKGNCGVCHADPKGKEVQIDNRKHPEMACLWTTGIKSLKCVLFTISMITSQWKQNLNTCGLCFYSKKHKKIWDIWNTHEENLKEKRALSFTNLHVWDEPVHSFWRVGLPTLGARRVLDLIYVFWASSAPNPNCEDEIQEPEPMLLWEKAKTKKQACIQIWISLHG